MNETKSYRCVTGAGMALPTAALVVLFAAAGATAAEGNGKAVYERTCIACHGANGKGALPGMRALGGDNGSLTKADAVLTKSILGGYQAPGGPIAMPAKGGDPSLTAEDAAAVLRYLRETFAQKTP